MKRKMLAIVAMIMVAGCSADPATNVNHDATFAYVDGDQESAVVRVLAVENRSVQLQVRGETIISSGLQPGADQWVNYVNLADDNIGIDLEVQRTDAILGRFVPVWNLTLYDLASGEYSLRVRITELSCQESCDTRLDRYDIKERLTIPP